MVLSMETLFAWDIMLLYRSAAVLAEDVNTTVISVPAVFLVTSVSKIVIQLGKDTVKFPTNQFLNAWVPVEGNRFKFVPESV